MVAVNEVLHLLGDEQEPVIAQNDTFVQYQLRRRHFLVEGLVHCTAFARLRAPQEVDEVIGSYNLDHGVEGNSKGFHSAAEGYRESRRRGLQVLCKPGRAHVQPLLREALVSPQVLEQREGSMAIAKKAPHQRTERHLVSQKGQP